MNTGDTPIASKNGLLTTIAIGQGGKVQYALEGSVFVGGAVIQWLRDEMRFLSESRDAEYYAGKVGDTGGVYLVPGIHGARRALLGHVCARLHHRHHTRHEARTYHPGRRRSRSPTRVWNLYPPWKRIPGLCFLI